MASSNRLYQNQDGLVIKSFHTPEAYYETSHSGESPQYWPGPQQIITLAGSASSRRYQHGPSGQSRRQTYSVETEIKRMLLLHGYPIMYITLWIPGLTNCVLEASGRPSSSEVLAAL